MNETSPHTVVLDTHVWFWMEQGSSRLQGSKCMSIVEAARRRGGVIVSAISVWEIAMLESKERIALHQDCHLWIRNALSAPGVVLQPLSPEIALESTRLPENFGGQPADRILVATSRILNAPLITADAQILAYGERKHVRTIAV